MTVCLALLAGAAGRGRAQGAYESVVQAPPVDVPKEDRAADASVVTGAPRVGETLPDLLAELPGVTISRTGGIGSLALVSLRGSTWDQVGVYLDGIPLNGALGGGVDLSTLPLGDVERVEVYRGSSPVRFGASALGGIVSITTRAPRQNGVRAELGAGSFGTTLGSLRASFVSRRLTLYAGAHVLETEGDFLFLSDNGTAFDTRDDHEARRTNNAVLQADGVASAALELAPGRELNASAILFWRTEGLPGIGTHQTRETSLDNFRLLTELAYRSRRDLGPGSDLTAQVYYVDEHQRYDDPLAEISIGPQATRDRARRIGAHLVLSRPVASWLRLTTVFQGSYELIEPFDADARPPPGAPATRLFGAAAIEADGWWARLRLHVIPSLRVEAANDRRSGRDPFDRELGQAAPITNVIPVARLAFDEQLSPALSLRANVGRYARLPSSTELYGDSGFVLGNPLLAPESGWNADVGARLRVGRPSLGARFDAALFSSFVDQLIQFQENSYGRARSINIGRARVLGADLSVDAQLTRYARLVGDGTFTDARDVSDTSLGARSPLLPLRPRFHLYARPEGRLPIGRRLVAGAFVELDAVDGNYLDPANLVALPSRLLVGAGLFVEAVRERLRLEGRAQNLGDARVFDFAGFPLPSRAFFVSLTLASHQEPIQ